MNNIQVVLKEFNSRLKTSIADVDKILESSIATRSLIQNIQGTASQTEVLVLNTAMHYIN